MGQKLLSIWTKLYRGNLKLKKLVLSKIESGPKNIWPTRSNRFHSLHKSMLRIKLFRYRTVSDPNSEIYSYFKVEVKTFYYK